MNYVVRWQPKGEATISEAKFYDQTAADDFAAGLRCDAGWELQPSVRVVTEQAEEAP